MLLTAGFFASKIIFVDFDPLQATNNYGMRDEQEKCFALQKGPLGHDHPKTWFEGVKRRRMLIYFVGLIMASYVRSVWGKMMKCFAGSSHRQKLFLRRCA